MFAARPFLFATRLAYSIMYIPMSINGVGLARAAWATAIHHVMFPNLACSMNVIVVPFFVRRTHTKGTW